MKFKKLADYVFETDVYTELNYDLAENRLSDQFDKWQEFEGGCSCAIKTLDNGQTIAGRNMDLTISNKPAYVVRTACPGKNATVALSYFYMEGPDYEEVLENGVPDGFAEMLPFLCEDVMNDQGLYVETNMRSGEELEDGRSEYGCTGTNPGKHRVCSTVLPIYIAENCANVSEALEYVDTLDIYTPSEKLPWNFTFIMGDESGHYGLLEIAQNKVSWLEGQQMQTNFYITPEFAETEDLKCGVGRYAVLEAGIDDVQSEEEMFDLVDQVTYFQIYRPNPRFDVRSEEVGIRPHWDTAYLLDDKNADEIYTKIQQDIEKIGKLSRKELQDACKYWESIFTVVANCNNRTLRVRFFEDNNRVMLLGVMPTSSRA